MYAPRCANCFESVTLIQPLDKQDMPRGKAKGHCVICGWREEIEMYLAPKPLHLNFKGRREVI